MLWAFSRVSILGAVVTTGQKFGSWTDLPPSWVGFGLSTEDLCAWWLAQLLRPF